MAGNNFKAKISMSELNYLPRYIKQTKKCTKIQASETSNTNLHSRWPAACICETPTGKAAKTLMKQNITSNALIQTTRTDEGTAFTGKEF